MFTQSLLCKANSDAYTINKILLDSSWSGNIYQYGQHDESIGTLDGATDVHYKISFSNDARQNGTLRVYVGSSEIYSYAGNGPITIEDDIQKEGSSAIKLSLIAGYGGGGNYETSYTFSEGISIVKNWEGQKEIKIYDVVGLGTEVSAYTLGRLPDKSRWDGGLGGGAGGLPVEFVEKIQLTGSSDNGQYIGKTYDYPVYVIATAWNTGSNEPQLFVVATGPDNSNNSYPSAGSYSQQYGVASGYAYAGCKIRMVKNGGAQNVNYDIYVYRLNLPS